MERGGERQGDTHVRRPRGQSGHLLLFTSQFLKSVFKQEEQRMYTQFSLY